MAAITAILAKYPEEVITHVTHPASGLPSQKNWLPTIKEVRDACDAAMAPIVQNEARENRIAEQLAAREEPRDQRPTYEQLQAKYGKDWGIARDEQKKTDSFKAPTPEQLKHHYDHYGLAFKEKPDAQNP